MLLVDQIKNSFSAISPSFRSQIERSYKYQTSNPQQRERMLSFAAASRPVANVAPVVKYPTPPARRVASGKPTSLSGITVKAMSQKLNAAAAELAAALIRYKEKHPAPPKLTGLALSAAAIKPQIKSLATRTGEPPEFKLPAPPAAGFKSHSEVAAFYGPLMAAAKERMATAERVGYVPQNITTLRPTIQRAWNLATAQVIAAKRK